MTTRFHKINFDTQTIAYVFEEANVHKSYESIFADFSKEELEKIFGAEKLSNGIKVGFNYLMLSIEDKNILIDTGRGQGKLLESMSQAGFAYDDITDVIITHGDGDHVGGIHHFKNANIYLPKKLYQLWNDEVSVQHLNQEFEKAMSRVLPVEMLPKTIAGRHKWAKWVQQNNQLNIIAEGETFLDLFSFLHTPAHRTDHHAVLVTSKDCRIIVAADAIRCEEQLSHPHLYSQFESNPELMKASVESIVSNISDEQPTYLFGTHIEWEGILYFKGSVGG